jgi:hypothetical protein
MRAKSKVGFGKYFAPQTHPDRTPHQGAKIFVCKFSLSAMKD